MWLVPYETFVLEFLLSFCMWQLVLRLTDMTFVLSYDSDPCLI
jgi:hypothetical protein